MLHNQHLDAALLPNQLQAELILQGGKHADVAGFGVAAGQYTFRGVSQLDFVSTR